MILSGFCEICVMHPLDVVKTRLQLQKAGGNPSDPHYYTSVLDCFKKTAQHEGLTALYKGVIPPVLVETPKRAVKVTTVLPTHCCRLEDCCIGTLMFSTLFKHETFLC